MLQENARINALLIAEACNPEWTSVPLEGWSHSKSIFDLEDVNAHIVTQIRNKDALLQAGMRESVDFTAIDSEAVAATVYRAATLLRGGTNKGWTTVMAMQAIAYPYFEKLVWSRFKDRLKQRDFDLVHRITPLSPTISSPIATRLRKIGIPFVIGPLNGGLPWPREFDRERRREKEWLSYIRNAYHLLPGFRSTRTCASAILCGSKATLEQMPSWCRQKCTYIPENGIDPARFPEPSTREIVLPLRVAFLGRLVPYKGADMMLRAAAPLSRAGLIQVDIIGSGPEEDNLKEIVKEEQIKDHVSFAGWIPHQQVHERLSQAHIFGFPSIREFGGGAVLEAMALGVVPVIVDYGGPGELVTPATGIAIPLGRKSEIIQRFREALEWLVANPEKLRAMSRCGRDRVMSEFTWDAKAKAVQRVYQSVLETHHHAQGL